MFTKVKTYSVFVTKTFNLKIQKHLFLCSIFNCSDYQLTLKSTKFIKNTINVF